MPRRPQLPLLLALLGCLPPAPPAQAQALRPAVTYDSAARHDFAKPHAPVAGGQPVAPGWTDVAGGVYAVSGGALTATSRDASGYLTGLALRPLSETAGTPDVAGTITVPGGLPTSGTAQGLVLRYQPDGTFYLFQLSRDTLYAYKVVGGKSVTRLGSAPVSPSPTHPYVLSASAVNTPAASGGGAVTLTVTARDMETARRCGPLTVLDDADPILSAGRAGVDSWVGNNEAGPMTASYARVTFSRLPPGRPPGERASPKIGFIGDSITAGYNQVGSTITPGLTDAAALTIHALSAYQKTARADAGVPWGLYDRGSSGSSTGDWLPAPGGLEPRAKAAFVSAFGRPDPKTNPVWVLIMLGTNDVRGDNLFSAGRHQNNLQAITDDLVASGFNVILNRAPAFDTATRFNGVAWDTKALGLLRSYLPGERAVADSFAGRAPGRVFLGDTAAFDYFAARPALFQEYGVYGGLHPNGTGGTAALAGFWARAFLRASAGRPDAAHTRK